MAAISPDERWRFAFGVSFDSLAAIATTWEPLVDPEVPAGIGELLTTSRRLFVHSWFVYEFMVVGCLVAIQAAEATCRQLVYPQAKARDSFQSLFARAAQEGRIPAKLSPRISKEPDALYALPELRNRLAHPGFQASYTIGMAVPIMEAGHRIVSLLVASTRA
jgi:hypothetical protein